MYVTLFFFFCVCVCVFSSDFLYKSICCGYSYLNCQVDATEMGTYNICLYKVDKKDTGCIVKTIELLDYAIIGV